VTAAGLDADARPAILESDEYAEETRQRERFYTEAGIRSVPASSSTTST
jgi:predicted DsbA family dithiol-disulfide isomerase